MKCTIKDIAEALGMSRNTVAKVLSGKEGVTEKTKELVLSKAEEMNYKRVSSTNSAKGYRYSQDRGSVLLLTKTSFNYSDFWISVMHGIETELEKSGYTILLGMIDEAGMQARTLPAIIESPGIKGIILVEICDPELCHKVLEYKLPTVTVDMPRDYESILGKMDIITMENQVQIQRLTEELINKGCTKFAFAGTLSGANVGHGFQCRYNALISKLNEHHLSIVEECCLTKESDKDFFNANYLIRKMQNFPSMPEVYICGNDWTAIQICNALQFLGYKIPKDISVVGFDNTLASSQNIPPLTTINTPKEVLGAAAGRCIINRINDPSIPYVYTQYMSELVYRDSTI